MVGAFILLIFNYKNANAADFIITDFNNFQNALNNAAVNKEDNVIDL